MKYIGILLVVIVMTNFLVSCDGEAQEETIHQEDMHFDTTYFQKNCCIVIYNIISSSFLFLFSK